MSYARVVVRVVSPSARALLVAATLAALAACQSAPPKTNDSLYNALGERPGIAAINRRLLLNIAADPRIRGYFQGTDIDRLHRMLTDYICQRAGGPCDYTGDTMVGAHRGLDIDSAAFNALVADLVHAMDAQHVPTATQNRLLARLAPLHGQIVGSHPIPMPEIRQLILGHDPLFKYIEPKLD